MFAWLEPEVILGSGAPLGPPLLPNDLRSIRFSRSAPSPLGGAGRPALRARRKEVLYQHSVSSSRTFSNFFLKLEQVPALPWKPSSSA